MRKKVLTLGSYHACYFLNGDRIPNRGETVIGKSYFLTGGGKGSNQAVVVALLKGDAVLIQNLGNDDSGKLALNNFKNYGLDPKFIRLVDGQNTGLASIMIDKDGENAIMVIPGAHGQYTKEDIDAAKEEFKDVNIAGFVLETNYDATVYAIKKAYTMGVQTLLDPTPVREIDEDVYQYLTYIKPNEHEASLLTGIQVTDCDSAVLAGKWFLERGVENVIITLGARGCVLITPERHRFFEAPVVKVVDTTTAGDIFAGSFMYAVTEGMDVDDSIIFASCSASLSVTKAGAMEAVFSLEEINRFADEFKNKNK